MSTMDWVGSAPEASSAPERTAPAVCPATAPGVPVIRLLPAFSGLVRRTTLSVARVDLAVGPDLHGLVVAAQDGVAGGGDEVAGLVGGELAVARVAHAGVGLDGEEAVAVDGEVHRLARVLERLRRPVGDGVGHLHAGRLRADFGTGDGVGEEQLPERLLRRALALVARGRRVREVVGDLVLAQLLGEHPRGCDVKAAVHVGAASAPGSASLRSWIRSRSPPRCCGPSFPTCRCARVRR